MLNYENTGTTAVCYNGIVKVYLYLNNIFNKAKSVEKSFSTRINLII